MTGGHLTALVRASEISGIQLKYDASNLRRELASTIFVSCLSLISPPLDTLSNLFTDIYFCVCVCV